MTELRKTVDIKTVDEDARTATGAALVPSELDHQHDFLRPDAVQVFQSDDVQTGVMHSAFPNDAATLERNEVINEAEEIGDETFPAGTWVATRRYEDDQLWQLVEDSVLQGFSIGGEISRAADHKTLPDDVRIPDDVEADHDAGGTELLAGTVNEVSDVDIPAVPRARYKSDLGKAILDDVDGEAEFVELLVDQRGHEPDDARRLYRYLTDVRASKGDGKPGDTFAECVQIIMEERGVSEADAREICGALEDNEATRTMSDSTTTDEPDDATKWRRFKSWLTGTDDAAGAEALDRKASDGDDEDDEDAEDDDEDAEMDEDKHAPAGETADDTMTDDDTTKDEPPAWGDSLTEKVESIENRVADLEGDDSEKAMGDAPEWAQDLAEKVEDLDERVETISKQSGYSQQLDGTEKTADDEMDETEKFKRQLVGGKTGGS
jgi:hypothetical protein